MGNYLHDSPIVSVPLVAENTGLMRGAFLLLSFLLLLAPALRADEPPKPKRLSADEMAQEAAALKYQAGTVTLQNGLATINLPSGWRFLDGPQAEKVLHDLWGNPPADPPLGMIFPPSLGPLDEHSWAVAVEYDDRGHVQDSDAAKIDYDDLLKSMQQQVRAQNPEREKLGYPAMELVGWAEPPHYDAADHKLYWAKDLRVAGDQESGVNYNVRVLGRRGVLDLDAIGLLRDMPEVKARMPELTAAVDFKQGNTYAEFDPRVDKVAEYGIAGLVAGTAVAVAAKAGLLTGLGKLLLPAILALKKFLVIIFVAVAAAARKIGSAIRGRSSVARPFEHPPDAGSGAPPATLNAPPPPNRDPLRPPQNPPGGGMPPTKSF
jgi:uncharacterized membrane-anchored protein